MTYCPKPNHIKPCWCNGVARCLGKKRNGDGCTRMVKGSAIRCWQHVEIGDTDE